MNARRSQSLLWPLLRYGAGSAVTGALASLAGVPFLAAPASFALGALADWRTGSRVTGIVTIMSGLLAALVSDLLAPALVLTGAGSLVVLLLGHRLLTIMQAIGRRAYEQVLEVQQRLRYWPYSPNAGAENVHPSAALEADERDRGVLCN